MPEAEMRRWVCHFGVRFIHRYRVVFTGDAGGGVSGIARHNGARLVIINREPTDLDEATDLVLNAEIGEVLSSLVRLNS